MIIIKRKSILVIFFSSVLIALVLIVTLIGFYIYLNLEEEQGDNAYQRSLYDITAQLYSKYIYISKTVLKIGTKGFFDGKPVVEGAITNNSEKKVTFMKLRVSVIDKDDRVLYMENLYPLHAYTHLSVISQDTGNYLAPKDTISLKHILRHCPRYIIGYLKAQNEFAKGKSSEVLRVDMKLKKLVVE